MLGKCEIPSDWGLNFPNASGANGHLGRIWHQERDQLRRRVDARRQSQQANLSESLFREGVAVRGSRRTKH
jgi:hypothetical protein